MASTLALRAALRKEIFSVVHCHIEVELVCSNRANRSLPGRVPF
jgi:hypothetical protein